MICTSHGVIWRKDPMQVVTRYLEWARAYKEDQYTILYDTMWNATKAMAEALAEGLDAADPGATVKLLHTAKTDKNDVVAEVFRSKAVLVGSSTINQGVLSSIGGILEELRGLKMRGKKAAAFGSYGWSGEGNKVIAEGLKAAGFEVIDNGPKELWVPNSEGLGRCRAFARDFAAKAGGV
jgi:flavorubredoxin